MRTHLEFRSTAFPAYPGEDEEINPGIFGRRLAEYLTKELPQQGLVVTNMFAEDWGMCIEPQNDAFPLWIGCANYEEYENGFLCFIEPSRPFVRQWLKHIPTSNAVERVATALEQIVRESGKAHDLRWWTEAEVGRGE